MVAVEDFINVGNTLAKSWVALPGVTLLHGITWPGKVGLKFTYVSILLQRVSTPDTLGSRKEITGNVSDNLAFQLPQCMCHAMQNFVNVSEHSDQSSLKLFLKIPMHQKAS